MTRIPPSTHRTRRSLLRGSTGIARLALLGMLGSLGTAAAAQGLPTGGSVSAGAASISGTAATVTINQSSQSAAINWQSFGIAAGNSVTFVQPNASAVALNRVLGPDPSVILGNLSANGKVFLVNPNGVLFGQSAQVNVGGLVASTLNLSDADFMAGRYSFSGNSRASVVNRGTINADGGYVALLGANVSNAGVIQARLGTVALAAGQAITLDMAGDGLLNVAVDTGAVNALVSNGGLIRADGGSVVMTAQAAGQLLHTAVNNSGIVEARTLAGRAGSIVMLGDMQSGTASVTGTLDASAPNGGNGGFIETSAASVNIAAGAVITTAAVSGLTGNWLIDPQDFIIATTGGNISGATLSALLVTNSVTITTNTGGDATVAGTPPVTTLNTNVSGNGDIIVNDAIAWTAAPSTTTLTLNALRDITINAPISATNGNVVLCCGRDVNINAAITTVRGSILATAGNDITLSAIAAITTTDGNVTLCAGKDITIAGAMTLTRGSTIPAQSLGLATGLTFIAGTSGTGPGIAGGTVIFAPLTPPVVVTGPNAPVTLVYNPISYTTPTDYSGNFTLTDAILTQKMLVFPNADKVFDGTTAATLNGFNGNVPAGVTLVAGSGATAVFDDPAVSGGTGVTFSGYTLGGANAAQYALAGGTCCVSTFRTTGVITAAVTPPVVTPPVVTPPVVTPPVVTPPVDVPPVVTTPGDTTGGGSPVVTPPATGGDSGGGTVGGGTGGTVGGGTGGTVGGGTGGGTGATTIVTVLNGATLINQSSADLVTPALAASGIQLAMIGQGVRMPVEATAQTVQFGPRQEVAQAAQPVPATMVPAPYMPEYAPKQDRH